MLPNKKKKISKISDCVRTCPYNKCDKFFTCEYHWGLEDKEYESTIKEIKNVPRS